MQTFSVYEGSSRPAVARGYLQCSVAEFAELYRCWHYLPRSAPAMRRAIRTLAKRGVLEIEGPCYRWKGGQPEVTP